MYARSTTVEADPDVLDDGVAHVRDQLMPTALEVDGCVGLSLLVGPATGRCVVTTAWRSAEAMHAGAGRLRLADDRLGAVLHGRPDDEEWEIAVVHRDHPAPPGACVRAVRVQVEPDRLEHGVDLYRTVLLPQIEEFPGFSSASLWVDRACGQAVSSVTFDSHDGGEVLDVEEFELALAHLHVPEQV